MSYRCDKCDKIREGKELLRVDIVREVTYNRNLLKFDRKNKSKVPVSDTSFRGTEIVSVERLCDSCYEEFKDVPPRTTNKIKEVQFVGTRQSKSHNDSSNDDDLDIKGLQDKWEGRK